MSQAPPPLLCEIQETRRSQPSRIAFRKDATRVSMLEEPSAGEGGAGEAGGELLAPSSPSSPSSSSPSSPSPSSPSPCGEASSCLRQEDVASQLLPWEKLGKLLIDSSASNGSVGHHHPLFNFSIQEALEIISATRAGYLDAATEAVFIACYACLVAFGVAGNLTVGWVIWRKAAMRTPRNLYIVNLAASDLSLCLVCAPVTLVGLLHKDWAMGGLPCRLVPVLQGANIMVSTSTVVAIAVDRHAAIVGAGMSSSSSSGGGRPRRAAAASLCAIWASSLLFTLPLYFYHAVAEVRLQGLLLYSRCVVRWPSRGVKDAWIIALLLTQYGIPIAVLGAVHARIKRFLGRHLMGRYDARRARKEMERNRKTTILLSTIAVAFAVCWLPWNVVNLLADFEYEGFRDPTYLYTVFGACHIIAMSSACINPVLYGWLNTNLRRELLDFLPPFFAKIGWILPESFRRRAADSATRQPESVTLLVFQANQTNTIQTVAHPPQTNTTLFKDDT